MPTSTIKCKVCGGEMVQKSRSRLLIVGGLMLVSITTPTWYPMLWAPAIILSMTGVYLIVWGICGQGVWCRNCKRFNLP